MLGLAFLLMAGLGAMVEERGLSSRSILNNPDLRPQVRIRPFAHCVWVGG